MRSKSLREQQALSGDFSLTCHRCPDYDRKRSNSFVCSSVLSEVVPAAVKVQHALKIVTTDHRALDRSTRIPLCSLRTTGKEGVGTTRAKSRSSDSPQALPQESLMDHVRCAARRDHIHKSHIRREYTDFGVGGAVSVCSIPTRDTNCLATH